MRPIIVLLLTMVLLVAGAGFGQNSQSQLYTGNLTSVNTAGGSNCPQCLTVGTSNFNMAGITVHGSYSGVSVVFEFSDDGQNWYPTNCSRTDIAVQEPGEQLSDSANRAWDCSVYNTTAFRVRPTTYTSGAAVIGITLSAVQIEGAPAVSLAIGPNVTNPVTISTIGSAATVQLANKLRLPCNALRSTNCN